jgi:hypothetical protein
MHLFRGLPRPNRAFVHFDFLPACVETFLGGRSFRVEQLRQAIERLDGLVRIAKTTGFGPELALAIADPPTRFGAACDACARAEADRARGGMAAGNVMDQIRFFVTSLIEQQDELIMSDTEKAIVAFGEASTRIQRAPLSRDSGRVVETCFRVALEAAEGAASLGQNSRESLVAAVAGSLSENLARRDLFARRDLREGSKLDEAIENAAALFVDQVWCGAFDGRAPASRKRRVAYAIYAWAFKRGCYTLLDANRPNTGTSAEATAREPLQITNNSNT